MLKGNLVISWRRLILLAVGMMALAILAVSAAAPLWAATVQPLISRPGNQLSENSGLTADTDKISSENKQDKSGKAGMLDSEQDAQSGDKAWLGLELSEADGGVKVSRVVEGSPAAKAGVKANDIITSVDDEPTTDSRQVIEAVQQKKPGDTVALGISRGTESLRIEVTSGSLPGKLRITPFFGSSTLPPELKVLEGIPLREMFTHFVGGTFRIKDKDGQVRVINVTPGSVSSVTTDSLTVELNEDKSSQQYHVTDATRLMGSGLREKVADLKTGTKVMVVTLDDSNTAAVVVRVSPVYSPLDQILPHLRAPQIWQMPGLNR